MKRAAATIILALAATLVAAAGCAAAHPATEDSESGAVTTSDTLVGTFASAATAHQVCTPGETRACKTYWTDTRGQLHCMTQEQVCRADGFRWQECGDLDAGAAPDAGADDVADASASTETPALR